MARILAERTGFTLNTPSSILIIDCISVRSREAEELVIKHEQRIRTAWQQHFGC